MRRQIAIKLHKLALRLHPPIAVAVRAAIILELAEQHEQTLRRQQQAHQRLVAARAARQ